MIQFPALVSYLEVLGVIIVIYLDSFVVVSFKLETVQLAGFGCSFGVQLLLF